MNTMAGKHESGFDNAWRATQTIALIGASIITGWTLHQVPSWQVPADPCLIAAVATAVTVIFLWLTLWLGESAMRFERVWFVAFLVGMPVVYVMRYLFATGGSVVSSWFWVELMGLLLFATFAALGVKRSPWFLVLGITAHGFGWDSWHYRRLEYIPNWYAGFCMAVDFALGAYIATRVPAYRERWHSN
ncbi:MAG TPA: hypothetical protein VG498_21150 [Terriglobales bacterium]|nr:hypothetical protein [Terriglobales bacterium]